MPEHGLDRPAVDIPAEIEEVHLENRRGRFLFERRPHANVRHAVVLLIQPLDLHRVHAIDGCAIPVQLDVRRRRPQLPAKLATVDHLAHDRVGMTQHGLRSVEVTRCKRFTDPRTRYTDVLVGHRVEIGQLEPVGFTPGPEQIEVAAAIVPEAEVVTNEQRPHADPVDQDVDELVRLDRAGFFVELETQHVVDAVLVEQRHFFAEARQTRGRVEDVEILFWLRLEADEHAGRTQRVGLVPNLLQDGLVATMHAVEVADRDDAATMSFAEIDQTTDDFHCAGSDSRTGKKETPGPFARAPLGITRAALTGVSRPTAAALHKLPCPPCRRPQQGPVAARATGPATRRDRA